MNTIMLRLIAGVVIALVVLVVTPWIALAAAILVSLVVEGVLR